MMFAKKQSYNFEGIRDFSRFGGCFDGWGWEMMQNILSGVLDDCLNAYVIKGKNPLNISVSELYFKNGEPISIESSKYEFLGIKDIILKSIFSPVNVGRVRIKDTSLEGVIEISGKLDKGIEFVMKEGRELALRINSPLASWEIVESPLKVLWMAYQSLEPAFAFKNKLIIKKEGANSIQGADNFEKIRGSIDKNANSNILMIDVNDEITTISPNVDYLEKSVKFAYTGLASIFKIPMTRLTGKSPDGLNATGDNDQKNQEATYKNIRTNIITPLLNGLGIDFDYEEYTPLEKMNATLEYLRVLADNEVELSAKAELFNVLGERENAKKI
ncbi:MAG: anti-CBASS protein Acb1 family protein [Alphaproteobacteria bacterium]